MKLDRPIAGYLFGGAEVARSPVTLEELRQLEASAGWSEEDARWLRTAAETLVPEAGAMVDEWRARIGRLPQLAAAFVDLEGNADELYKAAIRPRFVQWISDVCLRARDQAWLDYQDEIGLRHTPAKKNSTDGGRTPAVVPERYLIAFAAVVVTSVKGFLEKSGRPREEVDCMQDAWTKAVMVTVALWARAYAKEGLW